VAMDPSAAQHAPQYGQNPFPKQHHWTWSARSNPFDFRGISKWGSANPNRLFRRWKQTAPRSAGQECEQDLDKFAEKLFQARRQSFEKRIIFADQAPVNLNELRITPQVRGRKRSPIKSPRARRGIVFSEKLVPKARLELARLASEVFETSASTIPPLGPAKQGLSGPAGGVNGL
jgi:hypothetical protein